MADRLNSWKHKELPDDAHEELAMNIAVAKTKTISPAIVSAFATKGGVATTPAERVKIAQRANELICLEYAEEGRPARS